MEGVNDDYQNAIDKSSHDLIVGMADVAAKHLNVLALLWHFSLGDIC